MKFEKELIKMMENSHDGKCSWWDVYGFMLDNGIEFDEVENGFEIIDLGFVSCDYLSGDVDKWYEIKEW